jgi:hypothetical protein
MKNSKILNSVVYLASKLKNYPKIKSIGVGIAGDIGSKEKLSDFLLIYLNGKMFN